MSAISFEWTQRHADRINYILGLVDKNGVDNELLAIRTFLILLAMTEQDFALYTYLVEDDSAWENSAAFLKKAGINLED